MLATVHIFKKAITQKSSDHVFLQKIMSLTTLLIGRFIRQQRRRHFVNTN